MPIFSQVVEWRSSVLSRNKIIYNNCRYHLASMITVKRIKQPIPLSEMEVIGLSDYADQFIMRGCLWLWNQGKGHKLIKKKHIKNPCLLIKIS